MKDTDRAGPIRHRRLCGLCVGLLSGWRAAKLVSVQMLRADRRRWWRDCRRGGMRIGRRVRALSAARAAAVCFDRRWLHRRTRWGPLSSQFGDYNRCRCRWLPYRMREVTNDERDSAVHLSEVWGQLRTV
jgi:hypothetical protein